MRLAQLSHTRLPVGMPALGARPLRSVRRPLATALATAHPATQNVASAAPTKSDPRVDGEQGAPAAGAATGAAHSAAEAPSQLPAAALEGTNLYSMDEDEVLFTVEDLLTA